MNKGRAQKDSKHKTLQHELRFGQWLKEKKKPWTTKLQ